MTIQRPAVAPPHPWMPAVWDLDAQGLPIRHRPAHRFADMWEARCGGAFLFDFSPMREVMTLTPCVRCDLVLAVAFLLLIGRPCLENVGATAPDAVISTGDNRNGSLS